MDNSTNALEWIVGLFVTICIAVGSVFLHVYGKIGDMEETFDKRLDDARKTGADEDRQIWNAHNLHVQDTNKFRERISEQLGSVAKRSDIDNLRDAMLAREDRILSAIRNGNGNGK